MFCRNQTSRATVARGSALEMEVKRGQFRLSVLENSAQDCEVQKLIEREVRIRDGTCKLLAACSQRDQALEASKTLLTSNSRILALMSRLQRMKEAQAMQRAGRRSFDGGANEGRFPCTGKVAISDVRIPLMWKDSEYFKNKGELHQCAVFGLLRLGTEIHNTDLVIVDRTLTDICFDETLIFSDVPPDFELRVELYSCCVEEDFTPSFSGRKLSRLGNSVTRASSKKFMATLETATGGSGSGGGGLPGGASLILPPIQPIQGPKYHLLAHTSLNLGHIQNNFRTHNLTVSGTEDTSFWLPLYGNMCCRLVAQPLCMTQDVIYGNLRVRSESSPEEWIDVYGVLKATELICYKQKNDAEGLEKPVFTILINKDARVRATEKDPSLNTQSITISNQSGDNNTYTIITQTPQDTQRWMEAFWQHFYDMSQWKLCCETLMKIEEPSSRKPGAVILKQGSLYHEMVTPSTTQTRNHLQPLNTPVSSEIQSLLSTYFNDSY